MPETTSAGTGAASGKGRAGTENGDANHHHDGGKEDGQGVKSEGANALFSEQP